VITKQLSDHSSNSSRIRTLYCDLGHLVMGCLFSDGSFRVVGCLVMGHLVMGHCVMGHFVMGRFVMGRFVCESSLDLCTDLKSNFRKKPVQISRTYLANLS
jgi:hypothetical protein